MVEECSTRGGANVSLLQSTALCSCARFTVIISSRSMQVRTCSFFLLGILALVVVPSGHAQWTKDITCPAGTVYRDLRTFAGEEFCERLLPGALRVKHGPYRFWVNPDFRNTRGDYTNGRQTGSWRECDKNGRCRHVDYPLIYPEEKDRPGLKPEIPVTFQHGKYQFDFSSCWSTWVTLSGSEDIDFNIGGAGHRCFVANLPKHVTEHGGEGAYLCWVPFSVGAREIPSMDLMHELPKLGLPQFCRPQGSTAEVLMIVDKHFQDFAYRMDVQCAAIERNANTEDSFVFRFNSYVTDLVNELAASDGPLITRLCQGTAGLNEDQPTEVLHEPDGVTLFRYRFNRDPAKARLQARCVRRAFSLQASCR